MNKEKKKSHKVLPLNEKVKVFNKGEKKKTYAETGKWYGKNKPIVKL